MNIKQNKIAVVNWGVLPKFHSKAFIKIHEHPSAETLKARKDFMVFKQRDLL